MAFGQQSGPPASGRQVQELLSLLKSAGHSDFRDARGPMGFTQRQAGGRFSREEAAEFIDRLQNAEFAGSSPAPTGPTTPAPTGPTTTAVPGRVAKAPNPTPVLTGTWPRLDRVAAEKLAAELRRRGWTVLEP